MINDFKCRDCGIVFSADDSQEVKCQACGSDNIDFHKPNSNSKKTLIYLVAAFVVAIGAGIGIKFLVAPPQEEQVVVPVEGPMEVLGEDEYGTIYNDPNPIAEYELHLLVPVTPNEATQTYSFNCGVKNLQEGDKVEYKLFDFATGKLTASSSDGKFTGIKPAKDGYKVVATITNGDTKEDIAKELTGFDPFPDKSLPKLTVAAVQSLINQMISTNNSSVLSANPQISRNVSIKCVGVRDDDVAPTGVGKLLQQVQFGIWSGMKVESLGYEEKTNRVNSITIRPIYAD